MFPLSGNRCGCWIFAIKCPDVGDGNAECWRTWGASTPELRSPRWVWVSSGFRVAEVLKTGEGRCCTCASLPAGVLRIGLDEHSGVSFLTGPWSPRVRFRWSIIDWRRSLSFCNCSSSWATTCIWTRVCAVERSSKTCSLLRWLDIKYLFLVSC